MGVVCNDLDYTWKMDGGSKIQEFHLAEHNVFLQPELDEALPLVPPQIHLWRSKVFLSSSLVSYNPLGPFVGV